MYYLLGNFRVKTFLLPFSLHAFGQLNSNLSVVLSQGNKACWKPGNAEQVLRQVTASSTAGSGTTVHAGCGLPRELRAVIDRPNPRTKLTCLGDSFIFCLLLCICFPTTSFFFVSYFFFVFLPLIFLFHFDCVCPFISCVCWLIYL